MSEIIRMGGGVIPRPQKLRNYDFAVCGAYESDKTLPNQYIIPEENIPCVHDQKDTMMCVAYSLCQCAEAKALKDGIRIHYSPSWTYARNENRDGYEGAGLRTDIAIKGSLNLGFLNNTYFDFDIDVPKILKLAKDRDDLLPISRQVVPKSYSEINYAIKEKKWDMLKKALTSTELPIILVSHEFFSGGSHAIIGIGYSDEFKGKNGRYVYFQNSWGENYKDNGRYYIPLDYVDEIYVLSWEDPTFPFTDVKKSDWYYDSVKHAYLAGFVQGISTTEFSPNDSMIRGDMAITLSRTLEKIESSVNSFIKSRIQAGVAAHPMAYKKASDCKTVFHDVAASDYYYDAIRHVCANDVMYGVGGDLFNPTASITRAEVAAIVSRIFQNTEKNLSRCFDCNVVVPQVKVSVYNDVSSDSWYYSDVYAAQKFGLMSGDREGTFAPDRNITRAEGCAVLCRLFKAVECLFEQV